MKFSVLDLAPVPEGQEAAQAIRNSVELAQLADRLGYHRYWLAEHHNMPGIASAATAVLIDHIAGKTGRIRVGSGGIMLPNHAPLAVAEAFGTLAVIHGDRIDLGLGRAPGGDQAVMHALRRNMNGGDDFPNDVVELMTYLGNPREGAAVRAHPGEGTHVPVWMLGSSLYGAQLAAALGLPYAFASHFAPAALDQAVAVYRSHFRETPFGAVPRFMLAVNVFVADTEDEARYIRSSNQLAFARLRTGQPGKLPAPVRDIDAAIPAHIRPHVDASLSVTAVGTPATVRARLEELADHYRPDEMIFTGHIFDHQARLKSFELAWQVAQDMRLPEVTA